MKALLIKDWKLLKGQKQFFIVVCVIALAFLMTHTNPSFVISYVTVMFSVFTTSTLQYDDYEKGMSYLLTFPVSRKEYVLEKYLFGVINMAAVSGVMLVAACAASKFRGLDTDMELMLVSAVSAMLVAVMFIIFTIPVQLKFGAEKSRIAWMAIFMVVFIIAFGGARLLKASGRSLDDVFGWLDEVSVGVLACTGLGISMVLMICSILLSIKFMEAREF